MSVIGIWDTRELKEWIDKVKGLTEEEIEKFNEQTIKEIAARALAKMIARTPVGDYPPSSGKVGGTLRRGWTGGENVDPYTYILNDIDVIKKGRTYIIILSNPIEYASYVEYGHRTREKKDGTRGWVDGQFFMKISEDEMQDELPALLEKKLNDFLGEYFK